MSRLFEDIERQEREINVVIQAVAVLLSRAGRLLDASLGDANPDRAEAVERAAYEIEQLVCCASTLAVQGRSGQRELRRQLDVAQQTIHADGEFADRLQDLLAALARLSGSEETLKRVVGCGCDLLRKLDDAVRLLEPTKRQLAAVDELLGRLTSLRH